MEGFLALYRDGSGTGRGRWLPNKRETLVRSLAVPEPAGPEADPSGRRLILKSHARAAGINRRFHPHTPRHSCASHLLDGGADLRVVQIMMGHADIGTTTIYLHVNLKRLREAYDKFHPRA